MQTGARGNPSAVEPTEKSLPAQIRALQNRGVIVFAFTARRSSILDTTLQQLKEIGVDFSSSAPQVDSAGPSLSASAYYSEGILFSNDFAKGDSTISFLSHTLTRPKRFFLGDDKVLNLESVQSALQSFNIEFIGYRYGLLDEMHRKIKAQVKDIQMRYSRDSGGAKSLTDDQAWELLNETRGWLFCKVMLL